MKKYLYYPNLEPPNTEWLKFAILYMEHFESIVPYSRRNLVTDEYRELQNETDLVEMFNPEYFQTERASIKTIEELTGILQKPEIRGGLFRSANILRDWKNQQLWTYQIYDEKFSYQIRAFIEENDLGKMNVDGMLLHKDVAFLFMTRLAQEISFERESSIITDNNEYDSFLNFSSIRPMSNRNRLAKGIVNLIVPNNLYHISISDLIKFRNKNRNRIRAFNNQLTIAEDAIKNGITERQFINDYNNASTDLTQEIIKLGLGIASIPFATYLLIQNNVALQAEYVKEIIGGMGMMVAGYYGVKGALRINRDQRLTERYFTNLSRLV